MLTVQSLAKTYANGYAALASGSRSSALAFAPEPKLARAVARQAAASAERSGR